MFMLNAYAIDYNSSGKQHPHGIISSHSGTKVQLKEKTYSISSDTVKGKNQFYSFKQFNIHSEEHAIFNDQGIQHSIARVTGSNYSWINGQLTSHAKNFYMMNPNGVLIGNQAKLNVSGSLYVTSADFIEFQDGNTYHADLNQSEILTSAPPSAFGFISSKNEGEIRCESTTIDMPENKDIAIIGRKVQLNNTKVNTTGGKVHISAINNSDKIDINEKVSSNANVSDAEISMNEQSSISVKSSEQAAGEVWIYGGKFYCNNSKIQSQTNTSKKGKLSIEMAKKITLANQSTIRSSTFGDAESALIQLKAKEIKVSEQSSLISESFSKGKSGDILLEASSYINISDRSNDVSSGIINYALQADTGNIQIISPKNNINASEIYIMTYGEGEGGDISITGDEANLLNGTFLMNLSYGSGESGNIIFQTKQNIVISGEFNNDFNLIAVESNDSGNTGYINIQSTDIYIEDGIVANNAFSLNSNAGNIDIHADQNLTMKNATVTAEALYSGNSGSINLNANKVIMNGGFVSTSTTEGEKAGNITFTGNHFHIFKGSNINASSSGSGQAGQIVMNALNDIHLSGNVHNYTTGPGKANTIKINSPVLLIDETAKVYSRSAQLGAVEESSGPAGKIIIEADQCLIRDQAKISTETSSDSNGGNILIHATQNIDIQGYNPYNQPMGFFSISHNKLYPDKNGDAGNIHIQTPVLKMNGPCASIQSGTSTSGKGGNVNLVVNQLNLSDRSSISTKSNSGQNAGDAGNVFINASKRIILKDQSQVSTAARNAGGGLINVSLQDFLYMENSSINSSVMKGSENGGDISISHPEVLVMNHSEIVAKAYEGDGGNIYVTGNNIILSSDSIIDASSMKGIDGLVKLKGVDNSSTNQINFLANNYLKAEQWSKTPCILRTGTIEDRFVMKSRDSSPVLPGDWQSTPPIPIMHFEFMKNPLFIKAEQLFQQGHFIHSCQLWMDDIEEIPSEYRPIIQSRIAYAYKQSGFYKKALALLCLENHDDSLYHLLCLSRLADIYLFTGQHQKAYQTIEMAMNQLDQFHKNEHIRAGILNHKGMIHAISGEYDLAFRSFQEALDHMHYSGNTEYDPLQTSIFFNQARLSLSYINEPDWNYLNDLYHYLIQAPDNRQTVFYLLEFCVLAEQYQKKYESYSLNRWIDTALATAYKMKTTKNSKRLTSLVCGYIGKRLMGKKKEDANHWLNQAIFWASSGNLPELEYQWQKGKADYYTKQKQSQLAMSHYDKALSILQPIIQEFETGYSDSSERFRTYIRPLYMNYADILLKERKTLSDQYPFEKTIVQAIHLVEGLKTREINNYFKDECVTLNAQQYPVPTQSPKNTAILYYIEHPDNLSLIVILPSGIIIKKIPLLAKHLRKLVNRFIHQLQNPLRNNFLTYSTTLYGHLIMPVLGELELEQIETIIIVPDGSLKNLAFSALFDGHSYLVEKFQIASLMALTRTNCFDQSNPVIDTVLACGLSTSVFDFHPLDHVEKEIQEIKQIYPCESLINNSFTGSNITELLHHKYYPVIHMATHANFGNTSDHIYLLAYDGKITMNQLDTIMRVNRYRKKPVELLTLSACRTAVGDERSMLGLSGVALKAGVKSVLATLWFVDDPASAAIIPNFYKYLSKPEISKAKALQMTQMNCIRSDRYSHPYYWAPFVLFGNWQ